MRRSRLVSIRPGPMADAGLDCLRLVTKRRAWHTDRTTMSVAAQVRFDYRDYCLLPEDRRVELIDGSFYMTLSPITIHQTVSKNFGIEMVLQLERKGVAFVFFAPMDVYLSDEDIVQPDVLVIDKTREKIIEEKYIRGAPDLAGEILSPTQPGRDRIVKKKLYHKFGVKEYWIVDQDAKSVEVWTWEQSGFPLQGAYTTGHAPSSVFRDLSVDVSRIF